MIILVEQIEILGVKIDNISLKQAATEIEEHIHKGYNCWLVVTPNSEMIVRAVDDKSFASILNQADLRVADGVGVVLASRLLQKPLPQRVAGFDLMQELISLAAAKHYSIYLLGGKPGIAYQAGINLQKKYHEIDICGYQHGYLDPGEEDAVVEEINHVQPDLLLVGMGVPRQEEFLAANSGNLQARVAITVGGSLDILAGKSRRAPEWVQRLNLEWLYRFIQEPTRLGRMMALPRFVLLVLNEVIRDYF